MTIKELLNKSILMLEESKIEDSNLKAKIILAYIISKPREYLFIYENEVVSTENEKEFFEKVDRLCKNIPLQYITHHQEFMGLNFYVDENVLIPRADTEILVEEVLNRIKNNSKTKILDMCTGSGIIAVSLAKMCKNVDIIAVDKSNKALDIAVKNVKLNDVENKIEFIQSDMFSNLENLKFDVIVSNPPYIETSVINTLDKDVLNEPIMALDGGEDGLVFYRIIAENSKKFLTENGMVFVEIGYNQKDSVSSIFENSFENVNCVKDLAGNDRVIIAENIKKCILR